MTGRDVYRKESKRWVAPKTSYDGDDWGNDEYDEYEGYDGFPEEDETVERSEPPAKQLSSVAEEKSDLESDLHSPEEADKAEPAVEPLAKHAVDSDDGKNTEKDLEEPKEAEAGNPRGGEEQEDSTTKQVNKNAESSANEGEKNEEAEVRENDNEFEDDDSSIQDIYGFYENRYSMHPYSAMLSGSNASGTANEYSDSNASLSTGRQSIDSEFQRSSEVRSSLEYQTELGKVPEAAKEADGASPLQETEPTPRIDHLNIRKGHSREASLENGKHSVSFSTPNPPPSGHSLGERPVSQFVDDDIAELYQGSSEFLNRPISTYHPLPPRDISDQSIKDLLTPRLEQGEQFETPEADGATPVPSLYITSASPRNGTNDTEYVREDDELNSSPLTDRQEPFAHDHDYVDKPGYSDSKSSSEDGSSDAESLSDRESESLHGTRTRSAGDADEKTEHAEKSLPELETTSNTDPTASEPFILPSERNRLQPTPSSPTYDEQAQFRNSSHSDKLSDIDSDVHSDKHGDSESKGHSYKDSEASGASEATGVTTSSTRSESLHDTKDSESADTSDRSVLTGPQVLTPPLHQTQIPEDGTDIKSKDANAMKEPQTIASKVKRPPQVDFSALLNNSGSSSESRCEQMRILRMREAEYSSGLETWLMTTMETVDKSMKIYVNGIPPADDQNTLDLPTSAKVSNVVHSSATNTKEKLGKVSEKSKSFFAKVIR